MENMSEQIVALIVKQLHKNPADVKMESRIQEDLRADSLDVVEILTTIEDRYGVAISDEEARGVKTIADVVKLVESYKK